MAAFAHRDWTIIISSAALLCQAKVQTVFNKVYAILKLLTYRDKPKLKRRKVKTGFKTNTHIRTWTHKPTTRPLLIADTRQAPAPEEEHTSRSCQQPLSLLIFTVSMFSWSPGHPNSMVNSCKYYVINCQHNRRDAHTQDAPKITYVFSLAFPSKM